jgi:hypothetical protein
VETKSQSQGDHNVAVILNQPPSVWFAATTARIVETGTSTILVYIVDDGRPEVAAAELVLTPTALRTFARFGRDLIDKTREFARIRQPTSQRSFPTNWRVTFGPAPANAVFNARLSDLVQTDFYFSSPRTVFSAGEAAKSGGQESVPLPATPIVSCSLDAWEFMRIVREAEELATRKLEQLGAQSLVSLEPK